MERTDITKDSCNFLVAGGEGKTITVVFVRHAQSMHNLEPDIWAGTTESPLTPLGKNQVEAVSNFLQREGFRFEHVYSSPITRAKITASAILAKCSPEPDLKLNKILQEQHFGIAEGQRCYEVEVDEGTSLKDLYAKGLFPRPGFNEKFPGGESKEDLGKRAYSALEKCVYPHLGEHGTAIAVVSHRWMIVEMIKHLHRFSNSPKWSESWEEMSNTAWTRVEISVSSPCVTPVNGIPYEEVKVNFRDVNQYTHTIGLKELMQDQVENGTYGAQDDEPELQSVLEQRFCTTATSETFCQPKSRIYSRFDEDDQRLLL